MSSFETLGLQEDLIRLVTEKGWDLPRDVQDESIPHILNGNDVLIASETGSGKTGALGLPMIQLINEFQTSNLSFNYQTEYLIDNIQTYQKEFFGINLNQSDKEWTVENTSNLEESNILSDSLKTICGDKINAIWSPNGTWGGLRSNYGACKGKYYFEVEVQNGTALRVGLGTKNSQIEIGQDVNSVGWGCTGFIVHGGKFLPIPGQDVCTIQNDQIDQHNTQNPFEKNKNIITINDEEQVTQTVQQREMVCFHSGDVVGIAADFDNNQMTLFRMQKNQQFDQNNTTQNDPHRSQKYITTRVTIIKDIFYPDIMYFPSITAKEATDITINFQGNFVNKNPQICQDDQIVNSLNSPQYLPFSHCIENYEPIQDNGNQDGEYTNYYDSQNKDKKFEKSATEQTAKYSNIKGIVITPTATLCEQLHKELTSFAKYITPTIHIGLCTSQEAVKSPKVHTFDIIVGTIGFLENLFGTSIVDRPKINLKTGSVTVVEQEGKVRRGPMEITQKIFDGTMFVPVTLSTQINLTAKISQIVSQYSNNDNDSHMGNGDELERQLEQCTSGRKETGPLLHNCIFLTIDEADAFGDRFNSQVIHRLTTRIKRDKDRVMTRYFLSQFKHKHSTAGTSMSTSPPQLANIPSSIIDTPYQLFKVPATQVIMCSATIDNEKMKLLYPILKKSFSMVHLRERYELPKNLLQSVIYLDGSKFVPHLKNIETKRNQKEGERNAQNNANYGNLHHYWPSDFIPEKFLDTVHEYAIELPEKSPFNCLNPINHKLDQNNESKDLTPKINTPALTPVETSEFSTRPPTQNIQINQEHIDSVASQRIIASQAGKMYKLYVLGSLLSKLTQNESVFGASLAMSTVTRQINPQDLSHLNVGSSDGQNVILDSLDMGDVEEGKTVVGGGNGANGILNSLTDLVPIANNIDHQIENKKEKKLDKFIIFCNSNNDCMRLSMYLSSLIESGVIKFDNYQPGSNFSDDKNDDSELPTHRNKKPNNQNSQNPQNSQNSQKNKNQTKKGGRLSPQESQSLSSYPSTILHTLQSHPLIGCLINKGQSKEQLSQITQHFQENRTKILITTDLGARGVDFTDVPLVIHYNIPRHPEVYVQRCGRTARGGKLGLSIALVNIKSEYIWHHCQQNHPLDECENVIMPQNHKLRLGSNKFSDDIAVEDTKHPCVKLLHEKIYFDDIQEKVSIRLAAVLPHQFSGSGDVVDKDENCEMNNLETNEEKKIHKNQIFNQRNEAITLNPGYDSIIGHLYMKQNQEDVCVALHKQHSIVILQQNELLSNIQTQVQRAYFDVINIENKIKKMLEKHDWNHASQANRNNDSDEDEKRSFGDFYTDVGTEWGSLLEDE